MNQCRLLLLLYRDLVQYFGNNPSKSLGLDYAAAKVYFGLL